MKIPCSYKKPPKFSMQLYLLYKRERSAIQNLLRKGYELKVNERHEDYSDIQ